MNNWNERKRPIRLEKRFEFDSYDQTRDFLDRLGDLCEVRKRFPDISFGKTYVNLTLQPQTDEKDAELSELEQEFAKEIDSLCD